MPTTKEAMAALELLIEGADECYEQRGDLDQPRATLRQFIEEAGRDAERFNWIVENAVCKGGGWGFVLKVEVPFDIEDIGCAIDAALAAPASQPGQEGW